MSENVTSDQKATIVSNVDGLSAAVLLIEKELGMRGDEPDVVVGTVSSDKISCVIERLDSIHARLNDVLCSVSGIG